MVKVGGGSLLSLFRRCLLLAAFLTGTPLSFFLDAGSWSLLINSFFNFVSLSPPGSNFFLPIFWKESFKIPKCQWSVGSWESRFSKSREIDLEVRQGYKILKPSPQESTFSRRLHPPSRSSTTPPQQHHWLSTGYSNMWAHGRHFSFKPSYQPLPCRHVLLTFLPVLHIQHSIYMWHINTRVTCLKLK